MTESLHKVQHAPHHRDLTNNWGTTGGKANSNVYVRKKCTEEYKAGSEQRFVKGKRYKEIHFSYAEKGQLLWWQIVKNAMRENIINNP